MSASLTSSQWWEATVWALDTNTSFCTTPRSGERKDYERSKNLPFRFPDSFIFSTLMGVPPPSRHQAPSILAIPDSLPSSQGRCGHLQSPSLEKMKPLTALLGEFFKRRTEGARMRQGEKKMAAEIALSVLDHLESNLILASSWRGGGGREEKEPARERGAKRERNKNKVKCFN